MSIRTARSVSQLGASFTPTPPKLSPPQVDLSTAPPAQLVHNGQGYNTIRVEPLVELVPESPVSNKSLNKQRARCYIEESAISETEQTPSDIVLQANLRRDRSARPRGRAPVNINVRQQPPVAPPQKQWDNLVHVRDFYRYTIDQS